MNFIKNFTVSINLYITISLLTMICYLSNFFGQTVTFLLFDIVLSIYITSLFKNNLRFLFLLHPVIIFFTSLGYEIPYRDVGVGWTYINTYNFFINPSEVIVDPSIIGLKSSYIGVIPFIWFPNYLFNSTLEPLTLYYSISVWTLFCALTMIIISRLIKSVSHNTLLLLVLFCVMSPISFDINSSIHRYHILILGLILFYISWLDLTNKIPNRKLFSFFILIFSLVLILLSKIAILISILLFVIVEIIIIRKIVLISKLSSGVVYSILISLLLIIFYVGFSILPDQYLYSDFVKGPINIFTQLPVIGFFARIVYSVFSPFPWLTFNQWELYGFNEVFLFIHILSTFIALWLIFSLFLNFKKLFLLKDEHRSSIIMALTIILTLSFSAVGHHVYIAPAIPFLSVIFFYKSFICNFRYPLFCIIFAEIFMFIV